MADRFCSPSNGFEDVGPIWERFRHVSSPMHASRVSHGVSRRLTCALTRERARDHPRASRVERPVGFFFVVVVVPCPDRSPSTLGSPRRRRSSVPNRRCHRVDLGRASWFATARRARTCLRRRQIVSLSCVLVLPSLYLPNVRLQPRRSISHSRRRLEAMLGPSSQTIRSLFARLQVRQST